MKSFLIGMIIFIIPILISVINREFGGWISFGVGLILAFLFWEALDWYVKVKA